MHLPSISRLELAFLGVVVLLGGFLRLYNIDQTMLFLSDQGRDAIIAKRILVNHDPILIGPVTSVGNMYLGPFYYYFMVPFLALSYPSPIGPAIGVAVTNTVSLVFCYLIGRALWNRLIGAGATLFLTLLPLGVEYSRFSWNPNVAIPVALGLFFFLVRWHQRFDIKQAALVGLFTGILIQLHYVTLTVFGVIGCVWLYQIYRKKVSIIHGLLQLGVIGGVIALLLLPLIAFNFRHQALIQNQFVRFFTSNEQHIQPVSRLATILTESEGRLFRIMSQTILGGKDDVRDRAVAYGSVLLIIGLGVLARKKHLPQINSAFMIASIWLGFAVLGTAFYSSSILDHYLLYCLPMVGFVWAVGLYQAWTYRVWSKILAVVLVMLLSTNFMTQLKAYSFTGKGIDAYKNTAAVTVPHLQGRYNLALISEIKDHRALSYRYFFETSAVPPVNEEDYHNLDYLVVIDELYTPDPLAVSIYEIQEPGNKQLVSELSVPQGPHVFIYTRSNPDAAGVQ